MNDANFRAIFMLHLHDQVEQSENEEIYDNLPWSLFTDAAKEYFAPGYEVSLKCKVDPQTGITMATGILDKKTGIVHKFENGAEVEV